MALSQRSRAVIALVVGAAAMAVTVRDQRMRAAQQAAQEAAERKAAEAAAAAAQRQAGDVIALWTGVPVPGEPMGLHVADVSVDPAGAAALVLSDNTTTQMKVEAALAQARLQPALPVPAPAPGPDGAAPPPAYARPGEPGYAGAMAQFLGQQTGFKPQLESGAKR